LLQSRAVGRGAGDGIHLPDVAMGVGGTQPGELDLLRSVEIVSG